LALSSFGFAACGGSDSGGGNPEGGKQKTVGEQLCDEIASYVQKCGPATPCDSQMVADCAKVVGLLSESMLAKTRDCMKAGGAPTTCLSGSITGLTPSEAQKKFATTFCDKCTGGAVPSCEQLFFASGDQVPEKLKIAGKVILPLGDTLVSQLETECATASVFTCVPNFSTCAQGVLAKASLPTETAKCLLDTLISGSSSTTPSTCGDGGGSGGSGGTGAGGGGGTGNVSGGGGTGNSGGSGGTGNVSGGGGSGGADAGCQYDFVGGNCALIQSGISDCDSCVQSKCCTPFDSCMADQGCASFLECVETVCATATDLQKCASDNCAQCAGSNNSIDLYNAIPTCLSANCSSQCSSCHIGGSCLSNTDCCTDPTVKCISSICTQT
jgi:hypothetical protein